MDGFTASLGANCPGPTDHPRIEICLLRDSAPLAGAETLINERKDKQSTLTPKPKLQLSGWFVYMLSERRQLQKIARFQGMIEMYAV